MKKTSFAVAAGVVGTGLLLRFLVALAGHNLDFESFQIVAGITARGGNVYAETVRYNYGPIWFWILHALNSVSPSDLRLPIIALLSLTDTGIFLILWRRFGALAASLFFLNPISIIITGYHNQFDNLAILGAMLAVLLIGDEADRPWNARTAAGLLLMGLSLATKHVMFILPLWLALKQKSLLHKLLVAIFPPALLAASFLPYWSDGWQGIIHHVLLYRSAENALIYRFLPYGYAGTAIWVTILTAGAFFCRRSDGLKSLLAYTGILVAFSPAIVSQYLAIPVAFVSVSMNPLSLAYTVTGTWFLLGFSGALHIPWIQAIVPTSVGAFYAVLTMLLMLVLLRDRWPGPRLTDLLRAVAEASAISVVRPAGSPQRKKPRP